MILLWAIFVYGDSTANLTQLLADLRSPLLAAELDSSEGLGVLSINPMPIKDNVIIDRGLGHDLPSVQAPLQFDIASDIDSDVDLDSPEVSARSTLHIVDDCIDMATLVLDIRLAVSVCEL